MSLPIHRGGSAAAAFFAPHAPEVAVAEQPIPEDISKRLKLFANLVRHGTSTMMNAKECCVDEHFSAASFDKHFPRILQENEEAENEEAARKEEERRRAVPVAAATSISPRPPAVVQTNSRLSSAASSFDALPAEDRLQICCVLAKECLISVKKAHQLTNKSRHFFEDRVRRTQNVYRYTLAEALKLFPSEYLMQNKRTQQRLKALSCGGNDAAPQARSNVLPHAGACAATAADLPAEPYDLPLFEITAPLDLNLLNVDSLPPPPPPAPPSTSVLSMYDSEGSELDRTTICSPITAERETASKGVATSESSLEAALKPIPGGADRIGGADGIDQALALFDVQHLGGGELLEDIPQALEATSANQAAAHKPLEEAPTAASSNIGDVVQAVMSQVVSASANKTYMAEFTKCFKLNLDVLQGRQNEAASNLAIGTSASSAAPQSAQTGGQTEATFAPLQVLMKQATFEEVQKLENDLREGLVDESPAAPTAHISKEFIKECAPAHQEPISGAVIKKCVQAVRARKMGFNEAALKCGISRFEFFGLFCDLETGEGSTAEAISVANPPSAQASSSPSKAVSLPNEVDADVDVPQNEIEEDAEHQEHAEVPVGPFPPLRIVVGSPKGAPIVVDPASSDSEEVEIVQVISRSATLPAPTKGTVPSRAEILLRKKITWCVEEVKASRMNFKQAAAMCAMQQTQFVRLFCKVTREKDKLLVESVNALALNEFQEQSAAENKQ